MINFNKKNILITGATGGIGSSLVQKFISLGGNVFGSGTKTEKLDEIKKKYPTIKVKKFDISDHSRIEEFIDNVSLELGGLDILINNAGITGPTAPLWEYDLEMWNKIVQINLIGTFNCCRAIVPNMIKNNYGRIVNIASVAGKDGNANASAYSSAKAGVIGLTKSLGKELAKYNIAVNAITPAGANTKLLDQMSKEHVQWMLSKVPRGRFLEVNELSSMVCWLSSEENSSKKVPGFRPFKRLNAIFPFESSSVNIPFLSYSKLNLFKASMIRFLEN